MEVCRAANNTPPHHPTDTKMVAIARDENLHLDLPLFGLNDYGAIAQFIVRCLDIAC